MADPVFDIFIGKRASESRVKVNGEDISSSVRGCEVKCMVGEVTTITLHVHGANARVVVEGAFDKEQVLVNG